MECPTYKVLLPNSKSAISDIEMNQIKTILADVPENDYYITIEPTPLNSTCNYTTCIIVLRKSCEEAEPILNNIKMLLGKHGIEAEKFNAILLWEESAVYLKIR